MSNITTIKPAVSAGTELPSVEHEINEASSPDMKKPGLLNRAKDYSRVVFSRESTYRGFVDAVAEDTPTLAIAATRGWANFIEVLVKKFMTTSMIFIAPKLTKWVSKHVAKGIFTDEEQKDVDKYLLFSRSDLETVDKLNAAKQQIIDDEAKDVEQVKRVFGGSETRDKKYQEKIQDLYSFAERFNPDEELRKKIKALKRKTIIGDAIVESSFWGAVPFIIRLFRRFILKMNRFTGTAKYLNDKDNDKLGNQKKFTKRQILGTLGAMFFPPLAIALGVKASDKENLAKGSFLSKLKSSMDMTHGVYPKLGMFFSYSGLPILCSKIFNAQGPFELVEVVMKYAVTASSLLLGDRATNGVLAKKADRELVDKYGIEPGVLYHKSKGDSWWAKLKNRFPEAAKFNDVMKKVSHIPELAKEAAEKYSSCFYKGFSLHTVITFALKYLVVKATELRALKALKKA